MIITEPRFLRQDQEVIAACLVENAYLALLDKVYFTDALIEVGDYLVWLKDATVHPNHNVVLEALFGLFEEELHIVRFEISKQRLDNFILQMGWKAIVEFELISN